MILYDDGDLEDYRRLESKSAATISADTLPKVRELASICAEAFAGRPCPIGAFLGVGTLDYAVLDGARGVGIPATLGTFGEIDAAARADGGATYRRIVRGGVNVLATNLPLLAARALYNPTASDTTAGFGDSLNLTPQNLPPPR